MRVEYSPRAREDLSEIWEFTSRRWDLDQADRYIGTIMDACEGLARGDRTGRSISDVRAGYLRYVVASHVVFFRHGAEALTVVRVLHQRMDPTSHLDDGS